MRRQWLCVSTGIVIRNWMYFAILNGNGLFKCDFSNQKLVYLGAFPNERTDHTGELYNSVTRYKHYLIFWKFNALRNGIYNLETDTFVTSPESESDFTKIEKGILHEECFYLIGYWEKPFIYKYDIVKKKGYYITYDLNNIGQGIGISTGGVDFDNERIYFPSENAECVVTYDWNTEQLKVTNIPKMEAHYVHLLLVDDKMYLLDSSGRLNCFDKKTSTIEHSISIRGGGERDSYNYMMTQNEYILIFPVDRRGEFACYNTKNGQLNLGSKVFPKYGVRPICQAGNEVYVFSDYVGSIERINLYSFQKQSMYLEDKFGVAGFYISDTAQAIHESNLICNSLHTYINNVESNKNIKEVSSCCGTQIFQEVE